MPTIVPTESTIVNVNSAIILGEDCASFGTEGAIFGVNVLRLNLRSHHTRHRIGEGVELAIEGSSCAILGVECATSGGYVIYGVTSTNLVNSGLDPTCALLGVGNAISGFGYAISDVGRAILGHSLRENTGIHPWQVP